MKFQELLITPHRYIRRLHESSKTLCTLYTKHLLSFAITPAFHCFHIYYLTMRTAVVHLLHICEEGEPQPRRRRSTSVRTTITYALYANKIRSLRKRHLWFAQRTRRVCKKMQACRQNLPTCLHTSYLHKLIN